MLEDGKRKKEREEEKEEEEEETFTQDSQASNVASAVTTAVF